MRYRIQFFLIAAVVTAMLAGCAGGESNIPFYEGLAYDEVEHTWTTEEESFEKLVRIMGQECAYPDTASGVYLLATDDQVVFLRGVNAVETDGETRVNAYTVFEIGSITKTFTATAVLQLWEQGKLELDDPLGKFFPEFETGEGITIRQLLHMQSGLTREFFPDEALENDPDLMKKYYTDGFSDEELLAALYEAEPGFAPGTKYEYSNVNYTLLAMIIEKTTGESYGEYIREHIFSVCGMDHSYSMEPGGLTSVPEPVPEGTYPFDFDDVFPTGYMSDFRTARGAGDICSCAADLLAFDRALTGGKLLSRESLDEMFNTENGYGCGWMSIGRREPAYLHSGGTPSYMSHNLYCQTKKYGNLYLIILNPTVRNPSHAENIMKDLLMNY
ncbi:MAG: beta-lactamase family protein [Oscillospiraceae bacterium]|nr:beta-lactamase family protein [Oscillospiraceae bacterium]